MKNIYLGYIIFFSLIFYCCSENNITGNILEEGLNFYLLKDSTVTASQITDSNIYNIRLAEKPFLSYKDIEYYNWVEHSFKVDPNKVKVISNICKNNHTVFGIPFIITVDRERIYHGAFWFLFSSVAPTSPYIDAPLGNGNTSNIFVINRSWDSTKQDLRNDPRIYNTLKKCGLLIE
ncbi:MAG: hypothetical protein WAM24_17770 [Ignavibacteriaceae bacterium]